MPHHSDGPYDFFDSYARSGNANGWITCFGEELFADHKRAGAGRELKSFLDQHNITPGADWQLHLGHSQLFLPMKSRHRPSHLLILPA